MAADTDKLLSNADSLLTRYRHTPATTLSSAKSTEAPDFPVLTEVVAVTSRTDARGIPPLHEDSTPGTESWPSEEMLALLLSRVSTPIRQAVERMLAEKLAALSGQLSDALTAHTLDELMTEIRKERKLLSEQSDNDPLP